MAWTEVTTTAFPGAADAITFATMKTRVALGCENLSSADPHYAYIGDYINEAKNEFVLMAIGGDRRKMNLFPELRRWRWSDVTVNGQSYLDLPVNLLVLDSVSVTRSTAAYTPGSTTEYPVTEESDETLFGQYSKSATGWPSRWQRVGGRVELWPTPTTAYLTRVVLRGLRQDNQMSGTDTLVMHPRWHPFVIDLAIAITMEKRGWVDEANAKRTVLQNRLGNMANLVGLERLRDKGCLRIAGTPGERS